MSSRVSVGAFNITYILLPLVFSSVGADGSSDSWPVVVMPCNNIMQYGDLLPMVLAAFVAITNVAFIIPSEFRMHDSKPRQIQLCSAVIEP